MLLNTDRRVRTAHPTAMVSLSQLLQLKALDDLALKPSIIAGNSMAAIIEMILTR
jgi:hypothetical protein